MAKLDIPIFDSIQAANKWGNGNYPHIRWSLDGLDRRLLQLVVKHFHTLAQSFPKVANTLTEYGVAAIHGEDEGSHGFAYYDRQKKGIYLNWEQWQDADELRNRISRSMMRGFLPFSNNPIPRLISHEFGHAVYDTFHGTIQYYQWAELTPIYVSKNAKRNELELFAETFASRLSSESSAGYIEQTYLLVIEALDQ